MSLRAMFVVAALSLLSSRAAAQDSSAAGTDAGEQATATPNVSTSAEGESLVYSVDRMPEPVFDVARDVTVITGDELRRKNARTLPEALMGEAGVFVQQTDYGAGAPIIRGLIGKQVLLLVDGVRMNNAIYRFGPNQYLATIDLATVERVEIVKGVGSVLGSDALGGIVNVITKKGPPASRPGPGGALGSRYGSADSSVVGTAEAYGTANQTRYFAAGTFRNVDDVRAGDSLAQPHTGEYGEQAALARLEWFATDSVSVAASYQALIQTDVPRTDKYGTGAGNSLEYLYGPQRMQLASVVLGDQTTRPWSDRTQVTLYWNRQDEAENDTRVGSPTVERQFRNSDTLVGATAEVSLFIGKSNQIIYGLDYSHDWISSERNDLNTATLVVTPKIPRFADGSTYEMAAAYAQDRVSLSRWLTFTIGGRFSYFGAGGTLGTKMGDIDIGFHDTALTGTASAVFHALPGLNVVASVTPGYRAPNIEDVSTWEERADCLEVPNPKAKPERIIDYELGVKYRNERLWASAFGYYSRLTDLLVRAPSTFAGQTWFDLNGNGIEDVNEGIQQKLNVGKAHIYGAGAQARFRVLPTLAVFGNATYTYGQNESASEPLDRIPPLFGAVGATWTSRLPLAPWAEVAVVFAGAQTRLSQADKDDKARIGPDGTDGWQDVSIRAGATVARTLRIQAAVENLLDQQYKYHGSGVYRPGRQVVLGAELRY